MKYEWPASDYFLNSFSYYANGRAILQRGNNKHISGRTTTLYLETGWCCRWFIAFAFLPAGVRRCEKTWVEVINVGGAMLLGNTTCRAQGRRCWILSSNNNGPREGIAGSLNAPREIYTKGMTIILVTNSQREDCPGEQCCEIVEVQRRDNSKMEGGLICMGLRESSIWGLRRSPSDSYFMFTCLFTPTFIYKEKARFSQDGVRFVSKG